MKMFWTFWIFVTIFCGCKLVHSHDRIAPGVPPQQYQHHQAYAPPPPPPNQQYGHGQQQYAQHGMTQEQLHQQQHIQQGQVYQQVPQNYQQVPQAQHPNAVPPGQHPNAVPQGQHPNAVPQGQHPNAVPQGQHPNAVPQGQHPNAVPHQQHAQQAPHHELPDHVFNPNVKEEIHHIEDHLKVNLDTEKMSKAELEFHYFKMHDSDNNNKLDGCELIKSLIHWHEQGNQDQQGQGEGGHRHVEKIFTDEELVQLIDPILEHDDLNNDGYIDYAEFVKAQQKNTEANNPPEEHK